MKQSDKNILLLCVLVILIAVIGPCFIKSCNSGRWKPVPTPVPVVVPEPAPPAPEPAPIPKPPAPCPGPCPCPSVEPVVPEQPEQPGCSSGRCPLRRR